MNYAFMSFSTPEMDLAGMIQTAERFGYDGMEPRLDANHAHGIEECKRTCTLSFAKTLRCVKIWEVHHAVTFWRMVVKEGATSQGGGGYGGAGSATGGGVAYGDPKLPLAPGSGGGGENGRYYGPGGGLVWIEAPAGVIRVNGTINASGVQAETHRQGGGSGGGVYLLCRTFEGSGSVLADGALGGNSGRGGAGGGRIAVVYDTEVQGSVSPKPTVTFSAKNGLASLRSDYGALGTLYFPDGAFIDLTNTLSGI